jgi:hypothetical protein
MTTEKTITGEKAITSDIAISGQLGMVETIKEPKLPTTNESKPPTYTVQQQAASPRTGLLPSTGDLKQAGSFIMCLLCLILMLVLIFRTRQKSEVSA